MGKWNKNLTYNELKQLYIAELEYHKQCIDQGIDGEYSLIRYCYFAILLTQLLNASRVSEATEAIKRFYDTGERKQMIRVRKTKKEKYKRYRIIKIPDIIERRHLGHINNCFYDINDYYSVKTVNIVNWLKQYLKRNYRLDSNTHTNRYAAITYLILEKNINPITVQKITKHTNINIITGYTSDVEAEKQIDNLIGDL